MSRFPAQPLRVRLEGLAGLNCASLVATIRHGNGTREIRVNLDTEMILRLADAIRATANGACDGQHHRIIRDEGQEYTVAHAVWHIQHPDMPMPCIDHSNVIDVVEVNALPAGEGKDDPDSSASASAMAARNSYRDY